MVKQNRAIALMVLVMLLIVAPMQILATDDGGVPIAIYETDGPAISEAIGAANKSIGLSSDNETSVQIVVKRELETLISLTGDTVVVHPRIFKDGNKKKVTEAMTGFVNSLRDSSIPDDRQQALMNEIQDIGPGVSAIMLPIVFEGTKGNIYNAYKILGPMLDFLSDVLGVGAIILIGLVLASTLADLAYIGLPMWREKQAESGKSGGKKPFMVSHEALSTVQEVEKSLGENYQNAYVLYFKRRAITYVVLSFCIMYLIGGQLSGIISFILNLASGLTG